MLTEELSQLISTFTHTHNTRPLELGAVSWLNYSFKSKSENNLSLGLIKNQKEKPTAKICALPLTSSIKSKTIVRMCLGHFDLMATSLADNCSC